MPHDKDDDDLYDEEFDFVDDEFDEEDDGSELEGDDAAAEVKPKRKKAAPRKSAKAAKKPTKVPRKRAAKQAEEEPPADNRETDEVDSEPDEAVTEPEVEEQLDEFGRPAPVANYVVHIYEYRKYKRTIDRDFTPEDADAFATDYNRCARSYGRVAVAGKKDVPPRKSVEMPSQPIA